MKTFLAALLLLAPALGSQTSFNAKIVPDPTGCPSTPFRVDGVNVVLDDSLVSLAPFAGQIVRLTGELLPSICNLPTFRVEAVGPATATLRSCGTPVPGCPMRFELGPPAISSNALYFSLTGEQFLPLRDPLGVSFLVAPRRAGVVVANPYLDLTIPPHVPVGTRVWLQSHHLSVGPVRPPGVLSNPLSFSILPGGVPCVDPTSCF